MFQVEQKSDSFNKKNSESSSKPSLLNNAEMIKGHEKASMLGAPAQMMVDEEEEEPVQSKAIQKASEEEEELVQGKAIQKSEEEEELQMKEAISNENHTSNSSTGSTTSLPKDVNAKMENSFGTSFANVNVYKDSNKATQLGALAYTQGNDVHFAPGQFNPNSTKGQELIGHEFTHVVQQRAGRVKPDTKQNKALQNVNTDKSLEAEADTMGTKAAQGKSAVVNGAGSGVQKQEEGEDKKINVLAEERTFSDDVIVPGMNNLGVFSYEHTFGRAHCFVLTGSKEQWSIILKYADTPAKFYSLVYGFLKSAVDPSWINAEDQNQFRWNVKKQISRAPNNSEITEFLKALYGVGVDTDLDLADKSFEQPAVGVSNDVTNNPMLGEFLLNFQGVLISELSEVDGDKDISFINEDKVKAIADQGTTSDEVISKNPVVIKAILQNALASALSASKCYLEAHSMENPNINSLLTAQNVVVNSAVLIKSALSAYDSKIKGIEKNAESIFDLAWSTIPGGGILTNAVLDRAKDFMKGQYTGFLEMDNTENIKSDYSNKFKASIIMLTSIIGSEGHGDIDVIKLANSNASFISLFESHIK